MRSQISKYETDVFVFFFEINKMNAKQRQLEERLSKKETEVINFGKVKMMFYSDVKGLIKYGFFN